MENEAKVISKIEKSLTLTGNIEIERDGIKQSVLNMNCSLKENEVSNIQTYVINQDLFLANSQAIVSEVQKFRAKATEEGSKLKCFVF